MSAQFIAAVPDVTPNKHRNAGGRFALIISDVCSPIKKPLKALVIGPVWGAMGDEWLQPGEREEQMRLDD